MGCGTSRTTSVKSNFHEEYSLDAKLGSGAYGAVFKAQRRNTEDPNESGWYAAKCLDKKGADGTYQIKKDFDFEISMLSRIKGGKNVVQLIDAFEDSRFCYVVMECCGPTIMQAFLERKNPNEGDLAYVFHGMIEGIAHCHSVRVVHRDIKPENFLVSQGTTLGDKGSVIKLCDLGFALEIPEQSKGLTEILGTPPFMAPEMLIHKKPYEFRIDVWSFGVSAYLMLFGTFPYRPDGKQRSRSERSRTIKTMIKEGRPKPSYKARGNSEQPSSHACEFVQAVLERDPDKRPKASQVAEMAYLKDCIETEIADESIPLEVNDTPMSPTKDFFRRRSRLHSLQSNFTHAAEDAKEILDDRKISPEALKIFEAELNKLQEKTGITRAVSNHSRTEPVLNESSHDKPHDGTNSKSAPHLNNGHHAAV